MSETETHVYEHGPDADVVQENVQLLLKNPDIATAIKATLKLGDLAREDHNRDDIRELDGIKAIFGILNMLARNEFANASDKDITQLQKNILRALTNITFDHSKNATIVCRDTSFDVVQFTIDCVSRFKQEPELARNACAALTNFAHDDDETRETIVTKNGIKHLLAVCQHFIDNQDSEDDLNLRFHTLRALENVAPVDAAATGVLEHDGLRIFKTILEYAQDENSVLTQHSLIIKVLSYMASNKESSAALGKSGILQTLAHEFALVEKVLRESDPDDAEENQSNADELVLLIIETLASSIKTCEENAAVLISTETEKSIVQQLIEYSNHAADNIQETTWDLLSTICEREHLQSKLVEQGFIPAVVKSIEKCVFTQGGVTVESRQVTSLCRLLRFSIKAIGFLALQDDNLEPLMQQGAVEALIATMNLLFNEYIQVDDITSLSQQMNVYIQRNACIAMGNLARSDSNCAKIVKLEGIIPLAKIMGLGFEPGKVDQNLVANAAFAFNNLTKPAANKAIILESAQQRKEILTALYNLLDPESPFVLQFYAADALANLSQHYPQNAFAILNFPNETTGQHVPQRSDILERLLDVLASRKDKMKLRYAVVKALVNFQAAHEGISKLVHTRVQSTNDFKELILEMEKEQEVKIQQMASEALKKLGIDDDESTFKTETTREGESEFSESVTEETDLTDDTSEYAD